MSKRKCDKCDKPATHHSVEIINGEKVEKHLCDEHAAEEGLSVKTVNTPINELLTSFVMKHAVEVNAEEGEEEPDKSGILAGLKSITKSAGQQTCDHCGITFAEFKEHSLLGCPRCYECFETTLSPLIERAHEGATHHVGKTPKRFGHDIHRQQRLLRLRKRLEDAVSTEDYELAAKLRDELNEAESFD